MSLFPNPDPLPTPVDRTDDRLDDSAPLAERMRPRTLDDFIGQEDLLGPHPWVYGLGEVNKKALETLMQYSQEQGLIGRKLSLEELFINTEAHS